MADTVVDAPVTSTPAPPAAPPPVVAPHVTEHNAEDRVYNRVADALVRAAAKSSSTHVPTPAPAPTASPATPPQVAQPVAEPPAAGVVDSPATTPPTIPDLDEIDFDAPEPEAPPVAAAPDATEDELKTAIEKGIPDEVENAFLRTTRGKRMLESFKRDRELLKPPDEGGVGHIPTIDEIREGYTASQELQAMRHEMVNDPASFVANLFTINPQTGVSYIGSPQQTKEVVGNIYGQLHNGIRQYGPNSPYGELLAAYSFPVFKNLFDHQYKEALALPATNEQEGQQKARRLDALQVMEWLIFKQARPLNLNGGAVASPAGPDPEKEALQRRVEFLEKNSRQSAETNMQTTARQIEGNAYSAVMKDIGVMFSRSGVDKIHDEVVLGPHKDDVYSRIAQILPKHDPRGWQSYEYQLQQAAMGQLDPAEPAKLYQRLFRNALRSSPMVKERLEGLVKGAKVTLDRTHATLAGTQTMTSTNGGQAAPASVLPATQIAKQPGESQEDYFTRRLTSKFPTAVRQ